MPSSLHNVAKSLRKQILSTTYTDTYLRDNAYISTLPCLIFKMLALLNTID